MVCACVGYSQLLKRSRTSAAVYRIPSNAVPSYIDLCQYIPPCFESSLSGLCSSVPCSAIPCCAIACCVPFHAPSSHAVPSHAQLSHVVLSQALPFHVVLSHALPSHAVATHAVPSAAAPSHSAPSQAACCAMLRRTMLHRAMHCAVPCSSVPRRAVPCSSDPCCAVPFTSPHAHLLHAVLSQAVPFCPPPSLSRDVPSRLSEQSSGSQ